MKLILTTLATSTLFMLPALAQEAPRSGAEPSPGAVINDTTQRGGEAGTPDVPVSDVGGGPEEMSDSVARLGASGTMAEHATLSGDSISSVGPFITMTGMGAWRVSDLERMSVYGAEGESIGTVKDVLVSPQGKVRAVLIGVGGFLGIGQKDVAVSMDALQFGPGMSPEDIGAAPQNTPPKNTTTDIVATGSAAAEPGRSGATDPDMAATDPMTTSSVARSPALGPDGQLAEAGQNNTSVTVGADGMPDRIVLNVTREELEAAPAFAGIQAVVPEQ